MELKSNNIEVESLGLQDEQEFSISTDDMGMIFELLRSKMYSNPIGSIAREVASNSRDANREVGKDMVPTKITIVHPNELFNISDLAISFEDEGPGISPQRMTDVFLKYAASTKRSTNKFTGGFGLGAKTPFAYSDVFHIITVSEGIKYHYIAYIDPSQKGKISRLSKSETQDGNGTKIVIPIKSQDRLRFEQEVIIATTFWSVKPVLKNFSQKYPNYTSILTTPLKSEVLQYNDYHNGTSSFVACIDGISYPLNTQTLKLSTNIDGKLRIVMPFENGVLNISSNRETLQYDDETIKILQARIAEVSQTIADKINQTISVSPNIFAAFSSFLRIKQGSDTFDLRKLYNVFNNINKSSLLKFNFQGTDLSSLEKLDFKFLNCNFYNSSAMTAVNSKPMLVNWSGSNFLDNPVYFCNTKLDSRKVQTLKNNHPKFTIVTLPKLKPGRHFNPVQQQKDLEQKLQQQKDQFDKLLSFKVATSFEEVEKTLIPKGVAKTKPLYTQIPVRVFMGDKSRQQAASQWGSKTLKYDKNNDKFEFETFKEIIFIPVESLNKISDEDDQKSLIGQICSFYLGIPIVIVNERYLKNFSSTQVSLEEAIKRVPIAKLEEVFDNAFISNWRLDRKLETWKGLTFPAQLQASIDYLKTCQRNHGKYDGPYTQHYNVLEVLKKNKVNMSTKLKDSLDELDSITKTYPLLEFIQNLHVDSKHEKKYKDALQHYITNLK